MMDAALFGELMDEARDFSLPALTLGLASEPLLNPGTAGMVAAAERAGSMDIRLGTNGQLLSERVADDLIAGGLTRLEISVDAADGATYRKIRPGGDFGTLLSSIDMFLERREKHGSRLPLLRLSFLTLPHNEGQLDLFLARFGFAADMVSIQRPIWFPGSRLERPPGLDGQSPGGPGREEGPGGRGAGDGAPPSPPPAEGTCLQPWQRLGLDALGRAWPCCSWYGEDILGLSAGKMSVHRVWTSLELRALRAAHLGGDPGPACRRCLSAGAA
jgi:hypothetical protein